MAGAEDWLEHTVRTLLGAGKKSEGRKEGGDGRLKDVVGEEEAETRGRRGQTQDLR